MGNIYESDNFGSNLTDDGVALSIMNELPLSCVSIWTYQNSEVIIVVFRYFGRDQ